MTRRDGWPRSPGDDAVIAVGAVVTSDRPPSAIVAGAKRQRSIMGAQGGRYRMATSPEAGWLGGKSFI